MKIPKKFRLFCSFLPVATCAISGVSFSCPAHAASFVRQADTGKWETYGLHPITTTQEYNELLEKDPAQQLVNLAEFIPGIALDIRYATSANLMERPVYEVPGAYMRLPAAKALKAVQKELHEAGYGLKIYDAYRPYRVTVLFYEKFRDTTFVASPYTGSRHNRGCAVDLTLIDLATGEELEMPTSYDSFTERAHSSYDNLPAGVLQNRDLLQKVMLKHGFLIYPAEWWHFDFADWKRYPVMDLAFEMLN